MRARAALLIVAVALGGCRIQGLQFREDAGFRVLRPRDGSEVHLPVVLRWTRPRPETSVRLFAVFVDRPPPVPGRGLDDLARDDGACVRGGRCPTEAYLEAEQIRLVDRPAVNLAAVPRRDDAFSGLEDVHVATVVPLDARLRRIGEHAASVRFRVVRADGQLPDGSGRAGRR